MAILFPCTCGCAVEKGVYHLNHTAITGNYHLNRTTHPRAASKLLMSFFIFQISTLRSALVSPEPSTPFVAILTIRSCLFLSNHSVWREDFFFNLPLLVFFQELFHNKCIYRIHYLWFSKIQYNGIQWTRVGDFALRGVMSTSLPPLTMWNFWRHFRGNERMVLYLANGFL